MHLKFVLFLFVLTSQMAANNLPRGFTPVTSGTRHEAMGYSVEVPGKGWVATKQENGIIFFKRIDGTESYHAGMSVTAIPSMETQAAFDAYAESKLNADSANPRYKTVRKDLASGERNGHWTVSGRFDFDDSGAVNLGKSEFLATRNAHLIMLNPDQPKQVIAVWFSWRGVHFKEEKFRMESERFFTAFQVPARVAQKR